jgi:hypothetical protein
MMADAGLRVKAGTSLGCLAPPFIRDGVESHHHAPDSLFAMYTDPTWTNAPSCGRLACGEPGFSNEQFVHVSFSNTIVPSMGSSATDPTSQSLLDPSQAAFNT